MMSPLDNEVGISGDYYLCSMTCSLCNRSYTIKGEGSSNTGIFPKCPYCEGYKYERQKEKMR